MAQSTKSRSNRRSSSTSYASTLTTLVFIALCVLGVWMLSSNSVVSSKTRSNNESTNTRTSIDNSATTNDFSSTDQDTAETITTTTNNNNNNNNNNSDDQSSETTTSDQESSDQTTTKSQDKKDSTTTTVYGDNPGQLPDDAIKNDDSNSNNVEPQKQQAASLTNEEGSDNNNDQKTTESEKVLQQISTSSSDRTSELEENIATAQDHENSKQNTESQNAAINELGENLQEQSTGGGGGEQDVRSFDTTQGSNKNNEVDHEQQRVRENNKGGEIEVTVNEQKQEQKENQKVQLDERHEITQKPKQEEKKRRKSSKSSSSSSKKKKESKKSWSTQADESEGEKERQKEEEEESGGNINEEVQEDLEWRLCNVTAGADYIPCLDNEKYLRTSHRKHYEHRERHCPEDAPTCLVLLPKGYKTRVQWPNSRDKIWYHNVPHTKLAEVKGHQNWVKLTGEFLTFPGGGTQFIHGALHYIDFLQQAEPDIAWGKHTRVILDVGCGVGSFGGFLFERDVIAMSFAPKDEHEAQVQFALERGIPAISAVMGTQRLQFPSRAFDLVHCARCRVPWHEDGGLLLLELNRVLRPGGFFVWSATPVYQTLEEDVEIWKQMTSLTKAMCWELVTTKKDALNQVGAAFYRKPTSNECYEQREKNEPPMCKDDDDPNDAWYVPLQACMHRLPADKAERGAKWPEAWPLRLQKAPYLLNNSQKGIYGKPAPQDFAADTERWKNVVDELSNIGISWSNVRNVMDMHAVYGGFAAALKDLPLWVFNVVNTDSPDTLPIIFERGLIGIYHDWCESFNTYPRTYDLLHADHLFSKLKNRCKLVPVIAEVDRIVRPGGILIVRDESNAISEVEILLKSLHWEITSKNKEGVLCAKKGNWRPNTFVTLY